MECENLVENLRSSFSLSLSPIWMDNSTTIECDEIVKSKYRVFLFLHWSFLILYFSKGIGSAAELAKITGSRAYERFTGPQIKHVYKYQPDLYENTERISLISSFLASLLIGNQYKYNRIQHRLLILLSNFLMN